MSEKKRAGLSRLQNMSSYDDLVAMAAGDDKGNIAHFEQGFKDKAVELPLSQLHSFPNHPFKVNDDDAMQSLSDSIRNRGVLHPIVVRKDPDGGYQIISGHRRKRACELAEIGTIPAYIVELSDDEAIILMADANFYQREGLLPSEKARAYRMKSDAIKRHQGVKGKNTIDEIGEGTSDSAATVKRFIRLSYLTDNLLDMVDEKKIGQEPAIHISFQTRREEVEHIVRLLKYIASELDIPVIVLSQCSRAVEQRPDHRPILSDLRETGIIEECADVVLFLYRDEYYYRESDYNGIAEIIIAKNNSGYTGFAPLAFIREYLIFANIEGVNV